MDVHPLQYQIVVVHPIEDRNIPVFPAEFLSPNLYCFNPHSKAQGSRPNCRFQVAGPLGSCLEIVRLNISLAFGKP